MAFESLTDKLQNTFRKLKGKGKVSEKDLKDAMREVKLALLEAGKGLCQTGDGACFRRRGDGILNPCAAGHQDRQ